MNKRTKVIIFVLAAVVLVATAVIIILTIIYPNPGVLQLSPTFYKIANMKETDKWYIEPSSYEFMSDGTYVDRYSGPHGGRDPYYHRWKNLGENKYDLNGEIFEFESDGGKGVCKNCEEGKIIFNRDTEEDIITWYDIL